MPGPINGKFLYKTPDGGAHWTPSSTGIVLTTLVSSLIGDPAISGVVYAGAQSGLWKSSDGGASWELSLGVCQTNTLVVDPVEPSTIYAGFGVLPLSRRRTVRE